MFTAKKKKLYPDKYSSSKCSGKVRCLPWYRDVVPFRADRHLPEKRKKKKKEKRKKDKKKKVS